MRLAMRMPMLTAAAALVCLARPAVPRRSRANMTFFVTSAGPGKGGELGGLTGADEHCQQLASAAGAGSRTWRAYLSVSAVDGRPAVNARDRIGAGPWRNAKGVVDRQERGRSARVQNNISKQTALTEKGEPVNGRGDTPNMHDILTGSQPDGRAFPGATRTRPAATGRKGGEGSAVVGHHDRMGLRDDDASKSWNSSHGSRGCSLDALKATGGNGLFYCFATN